MRMHFSRQHMRRNVLAVRLAVRLSVGQPGLFMVVDCEFVSPQCLSADQDIDIDLSDLPSVYARK